MTTTRSGRHTGEPRLYRIGSHKVTRLSTHKSINEKSLHLLIERHLQEFFGVTMLAREFSTGKNHRGRIDTLGIDERASPVIIEYKPRKSANLVNQVVFYLEWLLDHRAEFKLLVDERLGAKAPAKINWSAPRLICVAQDFNRYDPPTVRHLRGRIELVRYKWFGQSLLMLEQVDSFK